MRRLATDLTARCRAAGGGVAGTRAPRVWAVAALALAASVGCASTRAPAAHASDTRLSAARVVTPRPVPGRTVPCATASVPRSAPGTVPAPPGLPAIAAQGGRVDWYDAPDGVRVRFATFPAQPVDTSSGAGLGGSAPPRGVVVFLPGRAQFVEANLETIAGFQRRGYAVLTLDWRGQGRSDRLLPSAPCKTHVGSFDDYFRDLDGVLAAAAHAAAGTGARDAVDARTAAEWELLWAAHAWDRVLVGQSMGGALALRYAAAHPGAFDRAIVGAPLVGIARPRPVLAFARLLGGALPRAYVRPGGAGGDYGPSARRFAGNALTGDSVRFARFHAYIAAEPPLALGGLTYGYVRAALRNAEALQSPSTLATLRLPILVLAPGADALVPPPAVRRLARHLPQGRLLALPGARHEVWLERDAVQARLWSAVDEFLRAGVSPDATPGAHR